MKSDASHSLTPVTVAVALLLGTVTPNALAEDEPKPTNLETVQVTAMRMAVGMGGHGLKGSGDPISPGPSAGFSDKSQETEKRDPCESGATPGSQSSGNPVIHYTGNKVEIEDDFASRGEMGLYLQRMYNHHWSATGLFGDHWLSTFDYSLVLSDGDELAWLQRPDGRRLKFLRDPVTGRWYDDRAQPVASIVRDADGSFTHYNEERGIERYDARGS